jgi:octaprenyl-diphosphate synthase
MHRYGMALGYAFQIADDVLDYASDAETLGKNLGDDLAEGKATLPLIHAMQHSDAADASRSCARIDPAGRYRCTAAGAWPRSTPAVAWTTAASCALQYAHATPSSCAGGPGPTTSSSPPCAASRSYAVSRDH